MPSTPQLEHSTPYDRKVVESSSDLIHLQFLLNSDVWVFLAYDHTTICLVQEQAPGLFLLYLIIFFFLDDVMG